ncbi:Acetyltransferase, GNAT family [Candidatus Protochlamydia naegleriophila]|uniref:Acetyltransferase, GNAT family n=1 Tax=Candidatus Protochlamydia naegleriophila TaxID=389348 RepID=A0A0U5CSM8_9BACT|nr:GNAT family N-acetyltransferase [Candidatus Protochlamydia naegleriophila]CUI18044.1 Acetyltransferase, GNAT family [Candidatus Protochlamydia naegleriophila]
MAQPIHVRNYQPEDAQALACIYYHTIHTINIQHYTKEQVDVWAPLTSLEGEGWAKKFLKTNPYVAVINQEIVGFAEFEPDGHIDCFYCHHNWIGKGVGSALMHHIFIEAERIKVTRLFAEVSITAKPFFEKQRFSTICEQSVIKDGVQLTNFKMEKILNPII